MTISMAKIHVVIDWYRLSIPIDRVAKEDPQARTVGGQAVHDGSQLLKHFCVLPSFVYSEQFTDVHLKTVKMIAFDNAPCIQSSLYLLHRHYDTEWQ